MDRVGAARPVGMRELGRVVERVRGDDRAPAFRAEPDDLVPGRVARGVVQLDPGREVDVTVDEIDDARRLERLEQEPEDVGVLLVLRREFVLPVPVRALDHVAGPGEGRRRHGLAVGIGREGDGAADVVVVHVGDHHGVDRVRRGPGLAEDIEQAARRMKGLLLP